MKDLSNVRSFLIRECALIRNPQDSSDSRQFAHIDELVDILLKFLQTRSESAELTETGTKIINSLLVFSSVEINADRVGSALESIATGFESFIKKLAEVKYGPNSTAFKGDGIDYDGFIKTTLGNLLDGKVAKHRSTAPPLVLPIVTFSYNSPILRNQVYLYVRNLRNEIHISPTKPLSEYLINFKYCVAALLLALEENVSIVRQNVDPIFIYLLNARNKFQGIGQLFVDVESDPTKDFDSELPDLDAIPFDHVSPTSTTYGQSEIVQREPITRLLKDRRLLWLIGEPGSGKTTSLQFSVFKDADTIINTGFIGNSQIPVYIPIKLLDPKIPLSEVIGVMLKITGAEVDLLLLHDKLRLVLDGMNEIPESDQLNLQKDILRLIQEYDDIRISISSRRYGFNKLLNFPTFELLPLSDAQIEEYIRKYAKDLAIASKLINQIRQADDLIIDFARNPLLLRMLIQVGIKEQIQSNFGQLLQKSISILLERERIKTPQTDSHLKERLLSDLAYNMRSMLVRSIDTDQAITILDTAIAKTKEQIGSTTFLNEVLANRILVRDSERQIGFFHELVLEYFTAVRLAVSYKIDRSPVKFAKRPEWHESLIILSGIIREPDDFVLEVSKLNLVLAARCISSGSKVSSYVVNAILNDCEGKLLTEAKSEVTTITALLELSVPDSFRLVVKHLAMRKQSFTQALSRCQRPEIIALRLLSFGLTGKNRIRQCLKVFINRPNTSSFINSDVIGNAQIILFSGAIEAEDILLVNNLGVSSIAMNQITSRIEAIINSADINSDVYAKTCELIGNHSILSGLADHILNRSRNQFINYQTGREFYHAFRVVKVIRKFSQATTLVQLLSDKILEKGFFNLLLLYLDEFKTDTSEYIARAIPSMVQKGKLSIIEFKLKFPEVVKDEDVYNAAKARLQTGLTSEVFSMFYSVKNILTSQDLDLLHHAVLNTNLDRFSSSKLIAWITKLNFNEAFKGIAIVTSYDAGRSFGFARSISDGSSYYFRNPSSGRSIKKNDLMIVRKISAVPKEPQNDTKDRHLRPRIVSFEPISDRST